MVHQLKLDRKNARLKNIFFVDEQSLKYFWLFFYSTVKTVDATAEKSYTNFMIITNLTKHQTENSIEVAAKSHSWFYCCSFWL